MYDFFAKQGTIERIVPLLFLYFYYFVDSFFLEFLCKSTQKYFINLFLYYEKVCYDDEK